MDESIIDNGLIPVINDSVFKLLKDPESIISFNGSLKEPVDVQGVNKETGEEIVLSKEELTITIIRRKSE